MGGTPGAKMSPQTDGEAGDPSAGRMSVDKKFQGDLG
jgi:hypothetical protein